VGRCGNLQKSFETPLVESTVDSFLQLRPIVSVTDAPSRMWRFDDRFLWLSLSSFTDPRDPASGKAAAADEGLHLKTHGLTGATAPKSGGFPKIVEELDYQADVWAFLHDFAFK